MRVRAACDLRRSMLSSSAAEAAIAAALAALVAPCIPNTWMKDSGSVILATEMVGEVSMGGVGRGVSGLHGTGSTGAPWGPVDVISGSFRRRSRCAVSLEFDEIRLFLSVLSRFVPRVEGRSIYRGRGRSSCRVKGRLLDGDRSLGSVYVSGVFPPLEREMTRLLEVRLDD